jgi:hypothetical protein
MNFILRRFRSIGLLVVLLFAITLWITGWRVLPAGAAGLFPDANPVAAAWQATMARGSYHFESELIQTNRPRPSIMNVGRSSREQRFRLEGQNDLQATNMHLWIWAGGGNLLDRKQATEVRIANGKTLVREAGGDWQETADLTGTLAPGGDFMSYLAGLRNVERVGTESKAGFTYTRYRFELDGPRIAAYVRDQMQRSLSARGELPTGMQLEPPQEFVQMSGAGELWVREDGLPLRQILDLRFPDQRDEEITARIDTTFRDFALPNQRFWPAPSMLWDLLANSLFILFGGLFAGMIIVQRRSRVLYSAVTLAIITTILAGPLLQSQQTVRFLDGYTARAATESQRSQQEQIESLRREVTVATIHPNISPLEAARAEAQTVSTVSRSSFTAAPTPKPLPPDDGVDSDGDGLTDYIEALIGTNPNSDDTDADGISDYAEVMGWSFGGQQWYGDPFLSDSNRDGIPDGLEWDKDGNGILDDTDGDGIPDIYDPDNDGDGVDDAYDLSPFTAYRPGNDGYFSITHPLHFGIDNLTPGRLTFVDFQLRPRNPKHLWYALNVLDWPADDAGFIQDHDQATLADIARYDGRVPDASEANGDLRLIPMLEIRFPASDVNLPGSSELEPYNIAVSDYTEGDRKVAYVPINLVTNTDTGERQAFQARMVYRPGSSWPDQHEVRLIWAIQMLIDRCAEMDDGACIRYEAMNELRVVQSYYEEWFLTGLNVREEHRTDLAIVYQNPTAPARPNNFGHDDAIWLLLHGLENSFLAARDENNDGQRDITVATIAADGGASIAARWEIPNVLSAQMASYNTLDQAIATTTMTNTVRILNDVFSPIWSQNDPIRPLFLFAREDRYRGQGLDSTNGIIRDPGGYLLRVDFSPAGLPLPIDTVASLNLTTYCAANGGVAWQACERADDWQELARRYALILPQPGDSADLAAARLTLLQFYYLALAQGISSVVEMGTEILTTPQGFQRDQEISSAVRGAGGFAGAGAVLFIDIRYNDLQLLNDPVIADLARLSGNSSPGANLGLTGLAKANYQSWLSSAKGKVLAGAVLTIALVAGAVVALIVRSVATHGAAETAFRVALIVVAVVRVASLVNQIAAVGQLISRGAELGAVLRGSSTLIGTSTRGLVVGLVIGVTVVWGVFIANVVLSQASPFSPQFNLLLAQAIAQTVLLIIMAFLSATVIGLLIVGIIAAIDAILTAICELGVNELRETPGLNGACFSINSYLTYLTTSYFYAFDSMVSTERADLIVLGQLDVTLDDPMRGYVAGNSVNVTLPVTTTLRHKSPAPQSFGLILFYLYLFNANNLRSSAFRYSLTTGAGESLNTHRGARQHNWQNVREVDRFAANSLYGGYLTDRVSLPRVWTPQAGINVSPEIYFNSAYAVPAYECFRIIDPWLVVYTAGVGIPVCYTRTLTGSLSNSVSELRFDILPATLDEFMAMVSTPDGGRKLAWDPLFPSLRDADGDGLHSRAHGGMDPDDANWDTDGDRISDRVELEWRQRGITLSPNSWDSDGDGLTDAQELALGTNPNSPDSDGDGLLDSQEVRHQVYVFDAESNQVWLTDQWAGGWQVRVEGEPDLMIWVSSDPNSPDTDGDGIFDQAEFELSQSNDTICGPNQDQPCWLDPDGRPWHPGIINTNPLRVTPEIDDHDRIVRPGQNLRYTTTVENLGVPPVDGALNVLSSVGLAPTVSAYRLELAANPIVTHTTDLTVATDAPRQITIESQAMVRLPDNSQSPWSWGNFVGGNFGTTDLPNQNWQTNFVAIAPERIDRAGGYRLTARVSEESLLPNIVYNQNLRRGETLLYPLTIPPVRFPLQEQSHRFLQSETASDIACNDRGQCMTVWDLYDNCVNVTINRIDVQQTSDSNGPDLALYFIPDANHWPANDLGYRQIFYRANISNPSNVQLNVTRPFCGTNSQLEVWESDVSGGPPSGDPRNVSGMTFLAEQIFDTRTVGSGSFPYTDNSPIFGERGTVHYTATPTRIQSIFGAIGTDQPIAISAAAESIRPPIQDLNPVVASDGENFLVAWEQLVPFNGGIQSILMFRMFDHRGAPIGPATPLTQPSSVNASLDYRAYTQMDLAWVGESYRLVYMRNDGHLFRIDVRGDGGIGINTQLATGLNVSTPPRIAYARHTLQSLVVFNVGGSIVGRVLNQLGHVISSPTIIPSPDLTPGVQVEWHPGARAWLVVTSTPQGGNTMIEARLLNPDGSVRLAQRSGQWPLRPTSLHRTALSCPSRLAYPVLHLPLEELPGATQFADTSGYNANVTCTQGNCPVVGVEGRRPVNLALRFSNSAQRLDIPFNRIRLNTFSLSFWFRTTDPTPMMIAETPQFTIRLQGGQVLFRHPIHGELRSDSQINVTDGNWHHVVVARSHNRSHLYVDGMGAHSSVLPLDPVAASPLRIGGHATQPFRGDLDDLALYDVVLLNDTVRDIYQGAFRNVCLAAAPVNHQQTLATTMEIHLLPNETRGGVIRNGAGLMLTVDAEPPTAAVTSVADRAYLPGNPGGSITHIIGGTADDNHGIHLVEVRVNNGAWQPAIGAATWTFPLEATSGRYVIESRATDVVGNVTTTPSQTIVFVDDRAPMLEAPVHNGASVSEGSLLYPTRPSGADHYVVSLSGAVQDPILADGAAGAGIVDVKVLFQDNGTGTTGTQWQSAMLRGGHWRIDYAFASGEPAAPRPDGQFILTVRAMDRVGKVTERQIPVVIDSTSPTASLSGGSAVQSRSGTDQARSLPLDDLNIITQTITLSGGINDVSGVASMEVAFTPIQRVRVISDSLIFLPFDEPAGATWLQDITAAQRDVSCTHCTPGEPGRSNHAVRVDLPANPGQEFRPIEIRNNGIFDFEDDDSFSFQTWVRTTQSNGRLLGKAEGSSGFALDVINGRLVLWLNGQNYPAGSVHRIDDGRWHHLVGVVDRATGQATLYQDGFATGQWAFSGAVTTAETAGDSLTIGGHLRGGVNLPVDALGYWPLDLVLNERTPDRSGYGSDGQVMGALPSDSSVSLASLLFDGVDDHVVLESMAISELQNNLTVAAWVRPAHVTGIQRIFSHERTAGNRGIGFALNQGGLRFTTYGIRDYDTANLGLQPTVWSHVAAVMDSSNNVTFYVNGVPRQSVSGSTPARRSLGNRLLIGANTVVGNSNLIEHFTGRLDEIRVYDRVLTGSEIARLAADGATDGVAGWFDDVAIFGTALSPELVNYLNRTVDQSPWLPATLAQPGAPATTWSVQVPEGLEGQYQLDLRPMDAAGQQGVQGYAWRGVIDTRAPIIEFGGEETGNILVDGNTGIPRYEYVYYYEARDRHLDLVSFRGPCADVSMPIHDFAGDAELAGLFPALTLVDRLTNFCTVWEYSEQPSGRLNVCDIYGRCTVSQPAQRSRSAARARAAVETTTPVAMIMAPTDGSYVAADLAAGSSFSVTVVAQAEEPLRRVEILLDNVAIHTLNYVEADNLRSAKEIVQISASEGEHTLSARATDWAGNVQQSLTAINITVDATAPAVTLHAVDRLTDSDTWDATNNMLMLYGTVADNLEVASVLVSIHDGPFRDATFDESGQWRTAIFLGSGAEGHTYPFTVRALDRAGHATEFTRELLLDLTAIFSDTTAPENVAVTGPGALGLNNHLIGTAEDASGIAEVEVEITTQPGGQVTTLTCTDNIPFDGRWSCPWTPATLNGLSHASIRTRAMDRRGNLSDWSASFAAPFDGTLPTLTLSAQSEEYLADDYLADRERTLTGTLTDNQAVAAAQLCYILLDEPEQCLPATLDGSATSATWSATLPLLYVDALTTTLRFQGVDVAGNAAAPLERQVYVDSQPPRVTVISQTTEIDLAFYDSSQPILAGVASDGSRTVEVTAILQSVGREDKPVTVETDADDGGGITWRVHPALHATGSFTLALTLRDAAGNASHLQSPLQVTDSMPPTHVWDGGGTSDNWSDAANWQPNEVPGPGARVAFDATTAKNAVVDTDISVTALVIRPDYNGTLLAGERTLTVAGEFLVSPGRFDPGSSTVRLTPAAQATISVPALHHLVIDGAVAVVMDAPLHVRGHLRLDRGTLDVSSAGHLLTVDGDFLATGGSFNARTGRVILSGPQARRLNGDGIAFHDLVLNAGLSGYWPLDEGTGGTVHDRSGHERDGVMVNNLLWSLLRPATNFSNSHSLSFRAGDYIALDNADQFGLTNGSFTVAAWINGRNFGNVDRTILGTDERFAGHGLHLVVRNGRPFMGFWSNDTAGVTNLATNQWTHLAWRYDAVERSQTLFVNGRQDAIRFNSNPFHGVGQLFIGRWGGGNSFDGLIDDVRIYNRSLSANDIRALGAGRHPDVIMATPETALNGYWPLDEYSGSSTADLSGNGNNGTLQGPTWSGTTASTAFYNAAALSFNGTSHAVSVGSGASLVNLTNNFSVAAWIRPQDLSGVRRIVSHARNNGNNGWGLGIRDGGLRFTTYGVRDYDTNIGILATQQWVHVAAVMGSNNHVTFYVNGVAVQTVAGSAPGRVATSSMLLGASTPVNSTTQYEFFSGLMDEVRVYGRALTAAEIGVLTRGSLPGMIGAVLEAPLAVNGDLLLNSGLLDVNSAESYPISIGGNFERHGGIFVAHNGDIIFTGGNSAAARTASAQEQNQTINVDSVIFNNFIVESNASVVALGDVTLTGMCINGGFLRETKAVNEAGLINFYLAVIGMDVVELGSLAQIQIDGVGHLDHPQAPPELQTGGYWTITPNEGAAEYRVNLTLKAAFIPGPEDEVCRYANGAWDCGAGSYDPDTRMITRNDVTQLAGDWAVRNNPGAGGEIYLPLIQANAAPGGETPTMTEFLYLPVVSSLNGEGGAASSETDGETPAAEEGEYQEEPTAGETAAEEESEFQEEPAADEIPAEEENFTETQDLSEQLEETETSEREEEEEDYLPQLSKRE